MEYQIFEAINSPGFLPMNCSIKVTLNLVNLKSVQSLQEVSHCWIQLTWVKKPSQRPGENLVFMLCLRSQASLLLSLLPAITLRHWSCCSGAVFYHAGQPGAHRQCPMPVEMAAVRTAQLPDVVLGHKSVSLSSSVLVT